MHARKYDAHTHCKCIANKLRWLCTLCTNLVAVTFFMRIWTHRHLSVTTDRTAGVCQDPPTEIREIV